jgi:hypothetical protein
MAKPATEADLQRMVAQEASDFIKELEVSSSMLIKGVHQPEQDTWISTYRWSES